MGKQYCHLTKTKRLCLESYLQQKIPVKQICVLLGVHNSTIYREIKRGQYQHKQKRLAYVDYKETYQWRYSADIAHNKYLEHLSEKGAPIKLGKDHALANYIEDQIVNNKISPKAVLGRIKQVKMSFSTSICTTTLYSYIRKNVFLHLSMEHLTFGTRKKPREKVTIKRAPRGTSIEQRPQEINNRNTFGHWEMDCVCGPTKNVFLVLTERLTRKEIIVPMKDQTASGVVRCLNRLERTYGNLFQTIFKSITVDNGSEFANHKGMSKSVKRGQRTVFYYCHPYCSSERGTNERINREIRRLVPKGTDLSKLSIADVQKVEDWVNNYPRGIFNYKTSAERFAEELSKIA